MKFSCKKWEKIEFCDIIWHRWQTRGIYQIRKTRTNDLPNEKHSPRSKLLTEITTGFSRENISIGSLSRWDEYSNIRVIIRVYPRQSARQHLREHLDVWWVHESVGKHLARFGANVVLTQFHFRKLIVGPLTTTRTSRISWSRLISCTRNLPN